MIRLYQNFIILGLAVLVMPVLVSCSSWDNKPTKLTQNRVQVEKEDFSEEVSVSDMSSAKIAAISQHYRRYGDGPVEVTVTYDASSRAFTAMSASEEASRIIKSFRENGIRNVDPAIIPVNGSGDEGKVYVSYGFYTAHAPKDCGVMPGFKDTNVVVDEEYKLGCTVETILAKQISHPKHLKGISKTDPTSSGRRATNIIETYRFGEPNESLDGESSSGDD